MNDYFIEQININKVRHLENIEISLGKEKKHLIFTGKNGCGKTSVLESLNQFLSIVTDKVQVPHYPRFRNIERSFQACKIMFNNHEFIKDKGFIYSYFKVDRTNLINKPSGINKIDFPSDNTTKLNHLFVQYIVNLKAEKSFARDDDDIKTVEKIDKWFEKFEDMLKQIFGDENLELIFDRKDYNFKIHRTNREPFDFNGLSSGYSAVIDIITELILKVETTESKNFDCQGIVLIDELETHLHVELQKNIFPLLTSFFPNIQFIVSTHSPFVLQSVENTVVYDLEKKVQTEDLSSYSYDALIESYFDIDKYSEKIKEKLARFEELSKKEKLDDTEQDEYFEFKRYFKNIPKFKADELAVKINEILLNDLNKR